MLPIVTGEFGVVQQPEIRWNDAGNPWAKFRGVAKDRKLNEKNEWVDGDATFIDVLVTGKMAEHITESVTIGDIVTVQGKLKQREWQSEGKTMKAYSIIADFVGVGVRFTPAPSPKFQQSGGAPAAKPAQKDSFEGAPF